MSDHRDDELPPLGEPTPASRRRRPLLPPEKRTPVVAVAALGIGLVLGLALGHLLARDGGDPDRSGPAASDARRQEDLARPPPPPPTTTTPATVPEECLETIRSAEQALVLLDQGLRALRQLQFGDTERALADMERLRRRFAQRARDCADKVRTTP